jgi:1-phosphofructokinase
MSRPVITVTLNPAIDETVALDDLRPGAVHRARSVRFDAGGKGVNVASCLADWGAKVTAAGLLGADNDAVFRALFQAKGIADGFIRIPGGTRTNIKLVHGDATTDINLPGLEVSPHAIPDLMKEILDFIEPDSIVVLAGSLPKGVAPNIYRDLISTFARHGASVALDTSGAPLKHALAADALDPPFCVKPNRAELEAWIGRPLPDVDAIVDAAQALLAEGIRLVVVSLGEKGALFAAGDQVLSASLPVIGGVSMVGAGDAMVAGIVAALIENADLERIARLATAFAVAKLGRRGPHLPPRGEVEDRARDVIVVARNKGCERQGRQS